MGYRINGRNLSVSRLMVRGKNADKRLKYIHVGPKGTSVISTVAIARVSLPQSEPQPYVSALMPQEIIDETRLPPESDDIIELPEGEPAINGPHYLVPQLDTVFPQSNYVTASFTCNGDLLRKLLTVACEVSQDGDKTLRLRICKDLNSLRIDTYRQPGDQEFCGVIKGIDYDGDYIPGDLPVGVPKVEKKPQQSGMMLKVSTGRRFK